MKRTDNNIRTFSKRKLAVSRRMAKRSGDRYVEIPAIILSGRWLEQIGFEAGKRIEVQLQSGRLTITIVS